MPLFNDNVQVDGDHRTTAVLNDLRNLRELVDGARLVSGRHAVFMDDTELCDQRCRFQVGLFIKLWWDRVIDLLYHLTVRSLVHRETDFV